MGWGIEANAGRVGARPAAALPPSRLYERDITYYLLRHVVRAAEQYGAAGGSAGWSIVAGRAPPRGGEGVDARCDAGRRPAAFAGVAIVPRHRSIVRPAVTLQFSHVPTDHAGAA